MDKIDLNDACQYKHIDKLQEPTRAKMLEAPATLHTRLNEALSGSYNPNLCGTARDLKEHGFTDKEAVEIIYSIDGHRSPEGDEVERAVNAVYSTTGASKKSKWPQPAEVRTEAILANLAQRGIEEISEQKMLSQLPDTEPCDDLADFLRRYYKGVEFAYIGTQTWGYIAQISDFIKNTSFIRRKGYAQLVSNPMKRTLTHEEMEAKKYDKDGNPVICEKTGQHKLKYANGGRCYEFASDTLDVVTFECDNPELLDLQFATIAYLAKYLPLVAIVYSGGKSYHATFSLKGVPVKYIHELRQMMVNLGADRSVLNPVHLTRLGCVQSKKEDKAHQRVLYLDEDARGKTVSKDKLDEFLNTPGISAGEDDQEGPTPTDENFPEPICGGMMQIEYSDEPVEVIEGVAARGEKLQIAGSSKAGKTWALLHLAGAIQTGGEFLGMRCVQGDVLFLNFELSPVRLRQRIDAIPTLGGVTFLNFRGMECNWPMIKRGLEKIGGNFSAIILDPIYKMLGDADENSNGDIAHLLHHVEQVAGQRDAMTIYSHHFSKGNKSGVAQIDRQSGAGAWGRDPDALLTLTPHAEDGCLVLEHTLRNYGALESSVWKFEFPDFVHLPDENPGNLKKAHGGNNKIGSWEDALEVARNHPEGITKADMVKELKDKTKASDSTARRYIDEAVKKEKIFDNGGLFHSHQQDPQQDAFAEDKRQKAI